jgi:hypothetical protein
MFELLNVSDTKHHKQCSVAHACHVHLKATTNDFPLTLGSCLIHVFDSNIVFHGPFYMIIVYDNNSSFP